LTAVLHTQPESLDLQPQRTAHNLERVRLTSLPYNSRKFSCQICACVMFFLKRKQYCEAYPLHRSAGDDWTKCTACCRRLLSDRICVASRLKLIETWPGPAGLAGISMVPMTISCCQPSCLAQSKLGSQYLHVNVADGDSCGKLTPGHILPLVLAVLHVQTSRGFLQNGRFIFDLSTHSALFCRSRLATPDVN